MMASVDEGVARLLDELGQALNLPGLVLDDTGACAIRFDPGPEITFQLNPQAQEELWLISDLGAHEPSLDLYATLLNGNLLWQTTFGATLSLTQDEPRRVIVARSCRWREMDCSQLRASVETFANTSEDWKNLITQAMHQPSDAASSVMHSGVSV